MGWKMKSQLLRVGTVGFGLATALALSIGAHALPPPAVQEHLDKAKELAGNDLELKNSIGLMCTQIASNGPDLATARSQSLPIPPPTKAFDNLYYVGIGSVGSWALTTSDGIILFDTLDNSQEAETYIVGGLKKIGLNPSDIKYIVITHGHGDHYGGALYMQDHYPQVHLLMSDVDYALAEKSASSPARNGRPQAPAPRRDMIVTSGQKLTLGDTTLTLYVYPGHTPGAISTIIPVKDHGKPHLLSFWGGTTPPRDHEMQQKYVQSFADFTQKVKASGAEGLISNHPVWDGTIDKLAMIRANPNGRNPYLIGKEKMDRYTAVQNECVAAALAQ